MSKEYAGLPDKDDFSRTWTIVVYNTDQDIACIVTDVRGATEDDACRAVAAKYGMTWLDTPYGSYAHKGLEPEQVAGVMDGSVEEDSRLYQLYQADFEIRPFTD